METQSINFLIKDSPAAVAIVDRSMRFQNHSDVWLKEFGISDENIIGKNYYDIIPKTPAALRKIHRECLKGTSNKNKGQKFILDDGRAQWFKWKINPWMTEAEEIGGLIIVIEDITEAKREEELLLIAEDVAKIGGWEVDMVTNQVYWTSITKKIHEVPEDYIPNLEEGINFYKPGEDREKITSLVSLAISEGKPWDTELRIITAKGREVWVNAKGKAELVNGKCIRIYGTFQDIDAKKKAALKFKEVSDRLAVATKGARVGIWDYDILQNNLVWDDNMYILYGIKREDFSGVYDAWQAGVHPDDKERGDREIAQAISGEKEFDTEFRVLWPNGEVRYIRAIAVTQRDEEGRAIKMTGTNWDITELKRTQMELVRSEESLAGAFQNSAIGMALVDKDGKWIKVNQKLCESLGYNEKELLKLTFQEITHKEDLGKDVGLLKEILNGERKTYQIEKRYYHKKGHLVFVILTVTAVYDITGGFSHFISQIMDITARVESKKRLTTLMEVTKEQNNNLMNFAHIVSHNLRSHSSNLSMLTNFLLNEEDEKEKRNISRMLNDASLSLDETVQHLNDVVQVKTGALDKLESISLKKAVKSVEKNISALLKDKHAQCNVLIPKSHFVNAVPAYLDSILLNLFTNGIKYSVPGRAPLLTISSTKKNGYIVLQFMDNGLGIDMERHKDKIFGMYKTFHANKDAKGIGLFITKNQIEAMNGKIEVDSKVGVGTTFTLHFKEG